MKPYFQLALFSLLSLIAASQPPTAVANTYTLTEKDGFSGFNYAIIYQGPSGKLYTKTYDGDIAIAGNNYAIQLEKISRLPGHGGGFFERSKNETWYFDNQRIVIIRKDTVSQIIEHPEWQDFRIKDSILCFILKRDNKIYGGYFNGTDILEWGKTDPGKTTMLGYFIHAAHLNSLDFTTTENGRLQIHQLNTVTKKIQLLKEYPVTNAFVYNYSGPENFNVRSGNNNNLRYEIRFGKMVVKQKTSDSDHLLWEQNYLTLPYSLLRNSGGYPSLVNNHVLSESTHDIQSKDNINLIAVNKNYTSFYLGSGNSPFKVFSSIVKYPVLFDGTHSNSIFSLRQDAAGNIWAGSYTGNLSIISENKVKKIKGIVNRITNGGSWYNGNMYLMAEDVPLGILKINAQNKISQPEKGNNGFYSYISRDSNFFYYGTASYKGLWKTTLINLEKGRPDWEKIDSARGIKLHNILTITEDTSGRIWCGHSKRGVAIYNPRNRNARTWLTDKDETPFGAYSSLTDHRGTVWIGSFGKGLWYYNDYTKEASPANCKKLTHPLLDNAKAITSLCATQNWLIISAYDKMLLLNLDSFYTAGKTILRYLNPQEAAFTSFTEQNTSLVSIKDSTIWFSTSDMLYQWSLKQWLKLPVYKAGVTLSVSSPDSRFESSPGDRYYFAPNSTSFDISIRLLSLDNLPRYMSAVLIRESDSLRLPPPSLQNEYPLKNLANGDYQFVVEVYEMDGTSTRYLFYFTIQKFLWQQWWFWVAISSLCIGIIALLLNLRRKKLMAEQKAKTKEAELQRIKAEQEKKLADLRVLSLSSQFRPHFILNALNTIGAKMENNPEAETVLSRLGESVNLIFNHATRQQSLHPFIHEWKLVTNIIDIHRLMYLKELETTLPLPVKLEEMARLQVPMGLLQIPVENALLHGLSNRDNGPWKLMISLKKKENGYEVVITDNGVGRKKSASLSNHSKHGTGTKNLQEIVAIINSKNKDKITFTAQDDVFSDNTSAFGTTITIFIPLFFSYES